MTASREGVALSASSEHPSGHAALAEVSLGSLTLSNRFVVAPMSRVSAMPDGRPSERMVSYYAAFAEGGFGLVISEGTFPDFAFGRGYAFQPGLASGGHADGWRAVTRAVHRHGTPILAQLMHAGALSQVLARTAGPSAIAPKGEKMPEYGGSGPFPMPKAMSDGDVESAITGFANAAVRAREAGFDGVEIHAANGYLLDQFITTYTNQRQDGYGGGPRERARLTRDVAQAIRAAAGEDFVLGVRLSQTKVNDLEYRWAGREEAELIFAEVSAGGIDYLHVASEGRSWKETAEIDPGLTITQLARSVTGLPVIANGGIDGPDLAHEIVSDGHADLISLARGALANPDWVHRLRSGEQHASFDPGMLHPRASIYNQDDWSARNQLATRT
jgi:2,4-dienoyl-CoA reductase-like NADH-dependent reductase (Old Yellow Enzyme family)